MLLLAEISDKMPTVAGTTVVVRSTAEVWGVQNSAMMRTVGAIVGIVAGLAVQVWLANVSLCWLWVAGFFPDTHPVAMRNVALCLAPCVLILISQGLLLWFAIVRPVMRRRRVCTEGRCAQCGYDLTGNVSGRCPECGVAVSLARSCDAERSRLACTDE